MLKLAHAILQFNYCSAMVRDFVVAGRAALHRIALLFALTVLTTAPLAPVVAADSSDPLATIFISATRTGSLAADVPVSASRIDSQTLTEGQPQVNLSETLDQVPGVVAQSRQNYAQDLQISVRGFGARSSFGVRGVRLYADGIPGTMPDGQGQFSHFDLSSAAAVMVVRGPFSALYGNSSGGVIALVTEDGAPGFAVDGTAEVGSLATERYALKASGDTGTVNYLVDATHFQTGGYRDHSDAERNLLNAKVRFELDDNSTLKLVVNAIETPFIQDPLGLTSAQVAADREQPGTGALSYNTRKSLTQSQAGLAYARSFGPDLELSATSYAGLRHTTQFQAIPRATELIATDPGGVIDLGRDYWGLDVHATARFAAGGQALTVTAGVSYDRLDEAHRSFLNFVGAELGIEGAMRVDEANRVFDFDQYLEADWQPLTRLRVTAGVRNSTVDVSSTDLRSAADADTGVHYAATNPVAGVTWRATSAVNLYASYGKGFETPTLNDLAYRSTNGSLEGLNFALRPARSENYEVGLKGERGLIQGSLAGFFIKTRDELAVEANANGRAVYQNIGDTERRGAEVALDAPLSSSFTSRLAYTYIRAVSSEPYATCVGTPCLPVVISEGARLPAVPANAFYAGVTWRSIPQAAAVTLEAISRSTLFADDRDRAAAAAYWLANFHATLNQRHAGWRMSESARVDNLTARRYIGSVIVNATNAQYFEPSPGRTFYLMLQVQH